VIRSTASGRQGVRSLRRPSSSRELAEFDHLLAPIEAAMGILPDSLLTTARRPERLRAFAALVGAVQRSTVSPELRRSVNQVARHLKIGGRRLAVHVQIYVFAGSSIIAVDTPGPPVTLMRVRAIERRYRRCRSARVACFILSSNSKS
jgi:hypothetical protein